MISVILAILLALPGSGFSAGSGKLYSTAEAVSYCGLMNSPQSFSEKRIRVRAIYRYGFEIQGLDPPTCCPERGAKIWVEIVDKGLNPESLHLLRKFPKGIGIVLATFEGTVENGGPFGDGGYRMKFTVDKIERLEATAKPSVSHDPAWIPKGCGTSKQNPVTAPLEVLHALERVAQT